MSKSINSRDKGARGERSLAKKLRECGWTNARRGQQYCGSNGDADVVGVPGLHIECKYTERLKLYDALLQAQLDVRNGEIPVVIHKKNNCDWVAILDLDDFLNIYKETDNATGNGRAD